MIRINGNAIERLLSRSAAEGICLRDVRPENRGATLWVPVGQVRPFGHLCRRYGCRFRLLQKQGFPFLWWKVARRKVMLGGLLLFLLLVPLSGMFVWQVDVVGAEEPVKSQVLAFCEAEGLKEGAFRPNCDTAALAEALLEEFEFLRFASIHTKGTHYTVEVQERLPEPVMVEESDPAQVVAKVDAVVTEVAVSAGTPCVKEGDVVQVGDLLIDGRVTLKDGQVPVGETLTHASGRVMGRFEVTWQETLPFLQEVLVQSDTPQYALTVEWGSHSITFPSFKGEEREVLFQKQMTLPFFRAQVSKYVPLERQTVQKEPSALEGALWAMANQQEETLRQTAGTVLEKQVVFSPSDEGLSLQVTYQMEGEIGLTEQITEGVQTEDE